MKRDQERNVYVGWGLARAAILLFVVGIYAGALEPVTKAGISQTPDLNSNVKLAAAAPCRKLLSTLSSADENVDGDGHNNIGDCSDGTGAYNNSTGTGSIDRIDYGDSACSKDNILVVQGPTSPLPNGIPTYTVQVQNACMSDSCSISDIHLSCGWFSSARLVDPRIFRRIGYDDCLVNNGEPLNQGEALSFQYANTFKYPLSVSSVACEVD